MYKYRYLPAIFLRNSSHFYLFTDYYPHPLERILLNSLNMLDQLKIKKIKPHLQNMLLSIGILLILKIQKF